MPDLALEREAIALFEAALEFPETEREALLNARAAGQPELLRRVLAMFAADRDSLLHTGAATDGLEDETAPSHIGAYRLVERIGRGGMGSVYLGERASGDFDHKVAIKIIKPGLLSEALIERFRRERQLLATLIHPHIAQLYDGGETETGSPFIVMEYVDGLPLLAWVETHRPSLVERRRLFGDICAAVAFAHRSLVVHRDLTPSNVLVARHGVAKLIDFGIARLADEGGARRDGSAPSIASLSLTPGYAAPERMTSSQVTTAADIYSLGRLLDRLIPSEEGNRELKAIVACATAIDPASRYPTADALGADLAAWGGGFPVRAMNGGKSYAATKFVRRHRIGVAAAALALLLLVGAFGLTVLANGRAQVARVDAERRFQQTRAIAKTLLFDAFDEVSRVPSSTRAREQLARSGLTYLDALAADRTAPVDVRIEAGLGYLRLAQVVGGGLASQLGRFQDANGLLARSEAILGDLHRRYPGDPRVRRAMAALLVEQAGTNLYNNNAPQAARRQAGRAQELVREQASANIEAARIHADALRAEGDTFLWTEDYARALALHGQAERFIAALPPAMARDNKMTSIRGANLRLLGEAHHKLGHVAEARRTLDQAVAQNRAVLSRQPNDPQLRRRLIASLRYRAVVHRTNKRDELARQSIEEARAEAIVWRDRDPDDIGALSMSAVVNEVYAQILGDLGRHPESFRAGEEVLAAHRRMVALAGNAPGALRSMAASMRTHGGNLYNGKDYAGACRVWADALAILAQLERRGALTDFDRDHSVVELSGYMKRACAPPRAGLEGDI